MSPGPKQRLLDAARVVLDREGLEGLTLRAIAREAGVSHGAPLRHYPSLAVLLAQLAAGGFEQLVVAVDAELARPRAPRAARPRLARAGYAYVHFALSEPGVYTVMFRGELCDTSEPAYQEAGAAAFQQLCDLVAAAQEDGWHAGRPTGQVAAVMWAKVHGLADLWLHGALQAVVDVRDVDELLALSVLADSDGGLEDGGPKGRSEKARERSPR
jgi:AcrR family transcriptional regulator